MNHKSIPVVAIIAAVGVVGTIGIALHCQEQITTFVRNYQLPNLSRLLMRKR